MLLRHVLEELYKFIAHRSKPIKFMSKGVALAGLKVLSKIKRFDIPVNFRGADYMMWYGMLLGIYESGTVLVCKRYLRPGMTVIDVGAHIGYYTCLFAKLVGPHGKVYAFEPHPDNFEILHHNIQRFRNVVPIRMAITDVEKDVVLYESSVGSGSHSLLTSRYPYVREIPVKGTSLDSFFKGKQVNLVKIDVEGAEMEVLYGMKELISCQKKLALILEFYPPVLVSRDLVPCKLLDTLADLGLKLYAIEENMGRLIPLESWGGYEFFIDSISKYVNLFCTKELV